MSKTKKEPNVFFFKYMFSSGNEIKTHIAHVTSILKINVNFILDVKLDF